MLDALDEQAGAAADNGCRDGRGQGVVHSLLHGGQILRVYDNDILEAIRLQDFFNLNLVGNLAL